MACRVEGMIPWGKVPGPQLVTAIERWSRQNSMLHRRDPRVKILSTTLILIAIGRGQILLPAVKLLVAVLCGRLPVFGVLRRAAVVLPLAFFIGFLAYLAGLRNAWIWFAVKSYLGAICLLVLASTTPIEATMSALKRLGAPKPIVNFAHFLHRYATEVVRQRHRLREAVRARGYRWSPSRAFLFPTLPYVYGYLRTGVIRRALKARGYPGLLPYEWGPVRWADALIAGLAVITLAASFR